MLTDIRLKIRHFYRKNKTFIFIVISAFVIIFIVNQYFKHRTVKPVPKTTYTPHTSVIDSLSSVPKSTSNTIEQMIDEYMGYCNDSDWASAFKMLSNECKKYCFNNDLEEYMEYMYKKMPTPKKYTIQDYSNEDNLYIYQVKYMDDFLATGLTDSVYTFTEEKIVFKKNSENKYEMSVGNYINYHELKNIFENNYLKIDLQSLVQYYSMEQYEVKFTNRSNYTIVIANNAEEKEVCLKLSSGDFRERMHLINDIVLLPQESTSLIFKFTKFYDNDDKSDSLFFNSVRVFENYTQVQTDFVDDEVTEQQKIEEQNSIAKFSVNLPIRYKE